MSEKHKFPIGYKYKDKYGTAEILAHRNATYIPLPPQYKIREGNGAVSYVAEVDIESAGNDQWNNILDKQVGGDHYKNMAIQPVEYILANGLDFLQGNVVKYISRFRSKNGKEDLEKAIQCIQLLIKHEYNN